MVNKAASEHNLGDKIEDSPVVSALEHSLDIGLILKGGSHENAAFG